MQLQLVGFISLLSLMIEISHPACVTNPNSAIISALLPLHSGNECSTIELRGLQQAAALQATVNALNSEIRKDSNININLKIQDTCSTEDGAIKAALKSMVDSDQTCLHPPFFMGFIGPEDNNILKAVYQVTKLFNGTHVVPTKLLEHPVEESNNIMYVSLNPLQSQAQSIIMALHQLEWTTFSLAVTTSMVNQNLAKNILEMINEDLMLCVVNDVTRIVDSASVKEALKGSTGHGIVVLADTVQTAINVLHMNKDLTIPMVLFVREIGLQSWQIPNMNSTLIIIQEISQPVDGVNETINSTMYSSYLRQQNQLFRDLYCKAGNPCVQNMDENVFQESLDVSVLPMTYAAKLMVSTLTTAHKARCRLGSDGPPSGLCARVSRMTTNEWQSNLKKSTILIKSILNNKLPDRIQFQMDVPSTMEIYSRNRITLSVEKIGQLINGKMLKLLPGYSFPSKSMDESIVKQKVCPEGGNTQVLPTTWISIQKATPGVISEPVDGHPDDEFYGMVTLLCGAGLGILLFFVIIIYIVYSNFRVKSDKQSTGSSPSFKRKPSRIARWRRGSGQSSSASIRTID